MRERVREAKGVLIAVVAGGLLWAAFLLVVVGMFRGGLVGYKLAQAQEPQTQQVPLLQPGTVFKDPATGKSYRVGTGPQHVSAAPTGYVICPNGHPVTSNVNLQDVQEATRCRDGNAFGPNCTAGSITYLCNPLSGLRTEMLGPTRAQWDTAVARGTVISPTFTEPHR